MKRGVVRALGWLAIAHGLSHAVLPLRGALAPAIREWAAAIDYLAFQLPYFVRERRMMLTIKALAEQHVSIVTSAR